MSEPWDIDDEGKFLIGFVAVVLALGIGSYHGCTASTSEAITRAAVEAKRSETVERARADVQTECLKAGHPALECKELR